MTKFIAVVLLAVATSAVGAPSLRPPLRPDVPSACEFEPWNCGSSWSVTIRRILAMLGKP